MRAGLRSWGKILSSLILCLALIPKIDSCNEGCWERCFKTYNTEQFAFSDFYDEFLKIALEISQLRMMYNISRVGYILDSSLSSWHNTANNPFESSLQNGTDIFNLQILIAKALAYIVNGGRNYVVQYDESAGWGCSEMSCLSHCGTSDALNKLKPVEMNPSSHCPGNLEAACHSMGAYMNDVYCQFYGQTTMAIVIANGNFFINDPYRQKSSLDYMGRLDDECPLYNDASSSSSSSSKSSSSSEERDKYFSYCQSYFDTRYVIATHDADDRIMKMFPSKHGNFKFISSNFLTLNAMSRLVTCLNTNCCANPFPITVRTCSMTSGTLGQLINNYPNHPILNTGSVVG